MKGSKGFLALDKFVINGKEVNAKVVLILHPFQFEMSSKPIKIQAKFDQSKWFIRVATDGSIPNMKYKKLAFTKDQSEYILRVTDESDEVKALKLNLELGNLQFSNKIVPSLPEQVTLAYNENSLAFEYTSEVSFSFNITGDYNGHSVSVEIHEAHGTVGESWLQTNQVEASILTSVEEFHGTKIWNSIKTKFVYISKNDGEVYAKNFNTVVWLGWFLKYGSLQLIDLFY